MNTVNSIERQRTTRRFAAFFAVSVGLIGLIFAAISFHNADTLSAGTDSITGKLSGMAENEKILTTTVSLQAATQNLKQYDDALANLGAQPGTGKKRELLLVNIRSAESQLAKGVANLLALKKLVVQPSSIKLVERLAGSYAYILTMRNRTDPMILSAAANTTSAATVMDGASNTELVARDKKIAELKKELVMRKGISVPSIAEPNSGENESLVQLVADSKRKVEQAYEQVAVLRKENAKLVDNNKELTRTSTTTGRPDPNALAKIEAMNADLSFSQVDCNLSRADAKQIISNSRQRRELLNEALKILNTLSQSDNAIVRKKAGEKLAALNYIAKNIRE